MITKKKTMTVELALATCRQCCLESDLDDLIAAVRKEADARWQKAIDQEIKYHRYAQSAIGESAVVALANVLKKVKETP